MAVDKISVTEKQRARAKCQHQLAIGFGYAPRAAFASHPQRSRGRLIAERESPTRSPFQRDRDRLIHSNAFRRLKHKTQVFIAYDGDHYRTRLTHTIEVSQIARALARALHLDEELAEAIALAHDFGHTPFGHAGEDALARAMEPFGGFDHNAQSLRIVTKLEHRYAAFDGLNLSWETLEGLVKHNGPLIGKFAPSRHPEQFLFENCDKTKNPERFFDPEDEQNTLPYPIAEFNRQFDLSLNQFASLEAQCAAIADDIAYNAHDIDDGLRAGLLSLDSLRDVTLTQPLIEEIEALDRDLDLARLSYELVRRQITWMVEDVITESLKRLETLAPRNVSDIHAAPAPVVTFSPHMGTQEKELKKSLFENLYFHPQIMERREQAETVVTRLFDAYMNASSLLPEDWQKKARAREGENYARIVCDFLAGMSDNYALREHQRLFNNLPDFL